MKINLKYENKLYSLDVEPSYTIEDIKKKATEIPDLPHLSYLTPDRFYLYYCTKLLEDNRTLSLYSLGENCTLTIATGYCYYINFDGEIYKKKGLGCSCCGGAGDLFGFMEKLTGIPREELYVVNGTEKIFDKDFNVKIFQLEEYKFNSKNPYKKIKIKLEDKEEFYIYYTKELTYDKLFELIAKRHFIFIGFINYTEEMAQQIKKIFISKKQIIFNGRIIDENEDLNKIENLNEITVVRKEKKEVKNE